MTAGSVKTFSCPSCGGTVDLRAVGISVTAVCGSCGSLIDVNNANFSIIREAAVRTRVIPIPLGRRATLYGIVWEVIGYSLRCDDTEQYEWSEYLLFNPYQGFRFLVEADGHWNFVTMLRDDVEAGLAYDNLIYKGESYRVFVRGGAKVKYVMGEFYWRVRVGEQADVADYINPPYMMSMEKSGSDVVWSRAVYVPAKTVIQAFGEPKLTLPRAAGVAASQPSPYSARLKKCSWPFVLAFFAITVLQFIFVSMSHNIVVYEDLIQINAMKGQATYTIPLDIPLDTGNLEFEVSTPINNNWLELSMSLVNDTTQESDDFLQTVEYYYGSDSDGPWTEGSQSGSTMLSAVEGGKYHLVIDPDSGTWPPVRFKLRVLRDVPTWGLYLLALGFISIYPIWLMLRHGSFERKRWAESDYAPMLYRRGEG